MTPERGYYRGMRGHDARRKWLSLALGWCIAALEIGGAHASGAVDFIKYPSITWSGGRATARTQAGKTVELGLSERFQREVETALERAKPIAGAATMIDVATGQVLAAAEIGKNPSGSLLFDPIAPAASLFKLVTTIALYERSDITPLTQVCTSGGLHGIEREHLLPAHGPGTVCTKFAHALGVSRNAVFAQLATQRLMRSDLNDVAQALGFGQQVALDVPARLGVLDVPYNDLEFARTAAGFQNSRLSAMGAGQIALTIASGGLNVPMHFGVAQSSAPRARVVSQRTARRLRDAMEVTIHSGTARSSFVDERGHSTVGPVQVAGKTGTLQEKSGGATTSWFVGFAPSEAPRVVISVVLQNPPQWHRRGHEVARDLLQVYLSDAGVNVPMTR